MGLRSSGTVTFTLTEVEGSTRLRAERPAEMAVALGLDDEIAKIRGSAECDRSDQSGRSERCGGFDECGSDRSDRSGDLATAR